MTDRVLCAVAALCLLALPVRAHTETAETAKGETVKGNIEIGVPDAPLANAGPIVVYLEAAGTTAKTAPSVEPAAFEIRQRHARFSPAFLVVARGDRVLMPNDDTIYHNVFSYSRPNDFDLGLYARGETREIVFDHTGPVNLYCSIHESMSATVYVAPSRLYAVAGDDGRFAIEGVPPGRYRLRTWSRRLPGADTWVDVKSGEPAHARVVIAAQGNP